MKPISRIVVGALAVAAVGILGVSVQTQDRGRGVTRPTADSPRQVREWDSHLLRMERAGELKVRKVEADTMLPGVTHQRLNQYYKGLRVFGGDVVRAEKNNETLSVFGTLYQGIDLDTTPRLGPEDAAAVFERETGTKASPSMKPELLVLPQNGSYVLAYRVSQYTRLAVPVLFVNAATGAIEMRYDNLQRQSAVIGHGVGVLGDDKKVSAALLSGVYVASDEMRPPTLLTFDLRGNTTRAEYLLLGWISPTWSDVASNTNNDWTDPAVVDAHAYMGWTYDYYYKRFGRRGLDDKNAAIRTIIHAVRRESSYIPADDYYNYCVNAFWCATCGGDGRGYAVFGDGNRPGYYDRASGQHYNYLAGALDAVAHELTHGLTGYTSDLIYVNESGALNEAFSDILATGAEFFYQSAGSGSRRADYLIGEDVVTPGVAGSGTGLRSLADPAAFGDPDHYSKRYRGTADNGGVHTNALIGGHAFYLAVEGGRNRTSGETVQGVGASNRDQIEKIFYRAFVYYLPSNATFGVARAATLRAAQDLYGGGSPAERAITQAWSAVGVN